MKGLQKLWLIFTGILPEVEYSSSNKATNKQTLSLLMYEGRITYLELAQSKTLKSSYHCEISITKLFDTYPYGNKVSPKFKNKLQHYPCKIYHK